MSRQKKGSTCIRCGENPPKPGSRWCADCLEELSVDQLGDGLNARYVEFAVRAVSCPDCKEERGQLCRGKGKNKLMGTVHAARRQALHQLRKEQPKVYDDLRREIVLGQKVVAITEGAPA